MKFQAFCSTEIKFLSMDDFKREILAAESRHIVLVMSESAAWRWDFSSFIKALQKKCSDNNGNLTWIKTIAQNPTSVDVKRALDTTGNLCAEIIIAIGGGSAIDLAKSISAFYNSEAGDTDTAEKIRGSIKDKTYRNNRFIDIIAVPSTAGTESEITQWATIWDEYKIAKYSIDDPELKPKRAIIVPELTISTPAEITISSRLDAMCQAIEAYWSKCIAPIVQEIAHCAVEILINNLRKAADYPDDPTVRENLCGASVLAELAFAQKRTTACHSISYPLTMLYNALHSFAASITLEAVGELNRGHFPKDEELFRFFQNFGGIMNYIDGVCDSIIKVRLSSFGITENDIPTIVDKAFTGGRVNNNPVTLTRCDVAHMHWNATIMHEITIAQRKDFPSMNVLKV